MSPPDGSGQSSDQFVIEGENYFTVLHHVGKAFPKAVGTETPAQLAAQRQEILEAVLRMEYPKDLGGLTKSSIRVSRLTTVSQHYPYNPHIA